MRFNWRRLITAEYGSAYIWLAAIPLVTLKNSWMVDRYNASNPIVWISWSLLAVATLAYAIARFLKKSGLLKSSVTSTA